MRGVSDLVILVPCVEQRRWREASTAFCALSRIHSAAGRGGQGGVRH